MEINRPTGASLGFGRTLLNSSYSLFLKSILTSVFNPQAPLLQALELESTPTRREHETRDPADENKKGRVSLSKSSLPHYGSLPSLTKIV